MIKWLVPHVDILIDENSLDSFDEFDCDNEGDRNDILEDDQASTNIEEKKCKQTPNSIMDIAETYPKVTTALMMLLAAGLTPCS